MTAYSIIKTVLFTTVLTFIVFMCIQSKLIQNIREMQNKIYHSENNDKSETLKIYNELIQTKRKQTIEEHCDEKERSRQYGVSRRLIIDRKNKITWCPICKAGSSVWMKIFAIMGGELNPNSKLPDKNIQVSKLAKKAYPFRGYGSTLEALNSTMKFIIVRHPFERLLSAFRDKLEDASKTFYHEKFGKHIIRWYRREENDRAVPTFEEFLRYIVSEQSFDEHWMPYFKECAPCFVNYDYIVKMETYEEDQKYLLDFLKIPEIELIVKINKWFNTNTYGRTNDLIKRKYFSQIPLKLLKSIYDIYAVDFGMFDYSPTEYFIMTKDYSQKADG